MGAVDREQRDQDDEAADLSHDWTIFYLEGDPTPVARCRGRKIRKPPLRSARRILHNCSSSYQYVCWL